MRFKIASKHGLNDLILLFAIVISGICRNKRKNTLSVYAHMEVLLLGFVSESDVIVMSDGEYNDEGYRCTSIFLVLKLVFRV